MLRSFIVSIPEGARPPFRRIVASGLRRLAVGLFAVCLPGVGGGEARAQQLLSFAEYGVSVHTGDHVPLWQVSNRHGLSSLDNSTYLRGGVQLRHRVGRWRLEAVADLVVADGFTSSFVVHQAYLDARYKWLGIFAGSRETASPMADPQLSSGGMTWAGNARPIPQIAVGIPEYVPLLPRLALRGEISYGWFTDDAYQKAQVGRGYWYTRGIKFHHKAGYLRIGLPQGRWQLELGITLDTQFGGHKVGGPDSGNLGNGWTDYLRVFFPGRGHKDGPLNERLAYQGNFLGSEYLKLTWNNAACSVGAYLDNHFDDFSAMGKLNGWDGLWGIELRFPRRQAVRAVVLEYLQTTNMSGPLHGLQDLPGNKTGGADNYYNNGLYPGWVHWGMGIANPLIPSPIYNQDGCMSFKYNRVKALHAGWRGDIGKEWEYTAKFSYNKTWGTPHRPIPDILENFSTFAAFSYTPARWKGWSLQASLALDMGGLYGNNFGYQMIVHKTF